MAEIVRMPKLSDTMTEGVVAKWHKKVGDSVKSGDLLADIETDKATMEFESFQDGVLLHIGVAEGKSAAVDSILAILGIEGEDIKSLLVDNEQPKKEEIVKPVDVPDTPKAIIERVVEGKKVIPQEINSTNQADNRVKVSPLAKALAEEKGLSLSSVQGTGDGGRIIKRDIENYKGSFKRAVNQKESFSEIEVSQMRKTIARRLSESKFSAPHFYLSVSIEMSKLSEARSVLNEEGDVKISFNDLVIKATALSLEKHPKVNSSWLGDKIRYNQHIHIGVAVAVDDGLLVPVVRFANTKSISQISLEVKELGKKAKEKKLQPSDWSGNTFSISNLGMYGIDSFTAIINPPDACIMAVGGISEVPVVKNGAVVPGKIMKVTLSCDHRVVDGATGAAFLQTFKKYLEEPILLFASGS